MAELERIGIAIGEDLLVEFDELIERRGYTSRSEAIRDLIRRERVHRPVSLYRIRFFPLSMRFQVSRVARPLTAENAPVSI